MLTGTWPFKGKTAVDVRHAVLNEEPEPLSTARPDPVPPRLQQILDRALKKHPKDRYQQVSQFRDDLRTVVRDLSQSGGAIIDDSGLQVARRQHSQARPMRVGSASG